jgi:hypothetical protein
LPVSALPDINYPTVTVTSQLPGADPKTMAETVASPLELQARSPASPRCKAASGDVINALVAHRLEQSRRARLRSQADHSNCRIAVWLRSNRRGRELEQALFGVDCNLI